MKSQPSNQCKPQPSFRLQIPLHTRQLLQGATTWFSKLSSKVVRVPDQGAEYRYQQLQETLDTVTSEQASVARTSIIRSKNLKLVHESTPSQTIPEYRQPILNPFASIAGVRLLASTNCPQC